MSHYKQPRTAGGNRLRTLRESCGKTQLDVELDANLGIGYLQRLELGKVQRPEQDTLERILAALSANFMERREVLELFGYTVPISIPNESEAQWAINVFQAECEQDVMPAYLLDCSHRLLAWNPLVPKLFGEIVSRNVLIPKLIFDPVDGFAGSVLNTETFFSAQIRALLYEQQRCGDEAWYGTFVDEMRRFRLFDEYWNKHNNEGRVQVPLRPIAPLKLALNHGIAQFRLLSQTFGQDHRFRVIYYVPADPDTTYQCLEWQQ